VNIVERRRQLHAWPEQGFTEFWTASAVIDAVRDLGYDTRWGKQVSDLSEVLGLPTPQELASAAEQAVARGADAELVATLADGGTGVVAELRGNRPGGVTALRFDMDALPVQEASDAGHRPASQGFRSEIEGQMHACGHDGHVAIGLELAARLADRDFPGTVRLVFQAAEEGGRGAAPLVAGGAMSGVDRLVALHLGLGLPVGTFSAGSIGFFANAKFKAVFSGAAAHAAAAPDKGRNALLGAASALLQIHALPRFAEAATRINVGVLRGGTAPNIIAARAELWLEARATDGAVNDELVRRARLVLEHAAAMHELGLDVEQVGRATTAACDAGLVAAAREAARAEPAFPDVRDSCDVGVSDDATLMMRAVQAQGGQATYVVVGASSPGPHHSPTFDVDESVLAPAAAVLERLVRDPSDVRPNP
jgi:aminobenzoyl-glutamate utilization protein A